MKDNLYPHPGRAVALCLAGMIFLPTLAAAAVINRGREHRSNGTSEWRIDIPTNSKPAPAAIKKAVQPSRIPV